MARGADLPVGHPVTVQVWIPGPRMILSLDIAFVQEVTDECGEAEDIFLAVFVVVVEVSDVAR